MPDIRKQIDYWINTATDDLSTAEYLIKGNKYLYGLFFCHLAIEKIIKAHIVKCTNTTPPKIHKLTSLLNKTDLKITDDEKELLGILMIYQLEGRYPELYPQTPSVEMVTDYLKRTKKIFSCLKRKLSE